MRFKKIKINIHSIRIKLLVLPLLIVSIVVTSMTMLSNHNTKESLLETMGQNGIFLLQGFIERLEDNSRSLEITNDAFEHHIRTAASAVIKVIDILDDEEENKLDNELMKEMTETLYVHEINYYSPEGVPIFPSM